MDYTVLKCRLGRRTSPCTPRSRAGQEQQAMEQLPQDMVEHREMEWWILGLAAGPPVCLGREYTKEEEPPQDSQGLMLEYIMEESTGLLLEYIMEEPTDTRESEQSMELETQAIMEWGLISEARQDSQDLEYIKELETREDIQGREQERIWEPEETEVPHSGLVELGASGLDALGASPS